MNSNERLTNILIKLGLVDENLANKLISSEVCPIRKLSEITQIEENLIISKVAQALDIEYFDFSSIDAMHIMNVSEYTEIVDSEFCRKNKMIPLGENSLGIITAFANPLDEDAKRIAEFNLGKTIIPVISEEKKILELISRYWGDQEVAYDERSNLVQSHTDTEVQIVIKNNDLTKTTQKFNIVNIVNKILSDAVAYNASDIHIEPFQKAVEIRYRIDGVMTKLHEFPHELHGYISTRMKILSNMNIAERRKPQDGRISISISGEKLDLRVSSLPNSFGEKIVLRLLRSNTQKLFFPAIGMPEELEMKICSELFTRGKLLLVTGPTGSGKTTTLYTALKYCIDGKTNIQTVEDPIEFQIPGINQIQVNKDIGMTFASALRSILRQDPDIIMMGEIRDNDSAEVAFQAADTGHLVLSTLHTNSAPSAITRLTNLGVEPYQIASSVSGILAQRLVRKLCPCCAVYADQNYLDKYKTYSRLINKKDQIKRSIGCSKCANTGYKGRLAIYSYLEVTPKVKDLIYNNAPLNLITATAISEGFKELHTCAIELLEKGETTFEEIMPYLPTNSKEEMPVPIDSNRISTIGLQKELTKTKILIVDDNKSLRKILAQALKKQMYDVIEADNGVRGLEQVLSEKPDLVLCDLNMPSMNGKDFLVKMKNTASTKEIPIVMLTDAYNEENELKLLELGANDFVPKSASYRLILTRLSKFL